MMNSHGIISSKVSSKVDTLSRYTIFNARKCIAFILELRVLSTNIPIRGDDANAFMRTLRLLKDKIVHSLARAFKFFPALL